MLLNGISDYYSDVQPESFAFPFRGALELETTIRAEEFESEPAESKSTGENKPTVRKNFPETWIWSDISTG